MFLSRLGLAGLGIGHAGMLSDVEAAVTSQAGVLHLSFVKSRAAGRVAGFPSRHGGSRATEEIDFARTVEGPPFRASMRAWRGLPRAHRPPTSHLAAGRFHGYCLSLDAPFV
jgi:hypothetical protein